MHWPRVCQKCGESCYENYGSMGCEHCRKDAQCASCIFLNAAIEKLREERDSLHSQLTEALQAITELEGRGDSVELEVFEMHDRIMGRNGGFYDSPSKTWRGDINTLPIGKYLIIKAPKERQREEP